MTPGEIWTAAQTAHGEARGESNDSLLSVCWVILNRSKLFAKSIRDVCLQPWQFSTWNDKDPNLKVIAQATLEDASFQRSYATMWAAATRIIGDPTGGATDYHTVAAPAGVTDWPPAWAKDYVPTARIGAHQFYRRTQ